MKLGSTYMKPKIETLTIERFRALERIELSGLGRVTLITGRNNTGKSSILEALQILVSDASPSIINKILRFREEHTGEIEDQNQPANAEGMFPWSSLFNGFPQFSTDIKPIVIRSNGRQRSLDLSLEACWLSEELGPDGSRRFVSRQQSLFEGEEDYPALRVKSNNIERLLPLSRLRRRFGYRSALRTEVEDQAFTCLFVSPYGGEGTATLGYLWDKIALSDREEDVVEALRIIDDGIIGVSMVGGEGAHHARTAIVRSKQIQRPVPLRSFGDGLNRLFGIILSLVNAKSGILLVDEFENGMHHTVQLDAWRAVFKLATRLDIQVVATSHSWDAIDAFQKAASEVPDEGVLIRLTKKGNEIIPTIFDEKELAVAARERIEVR